MIANALYTEVKPDITAIATPLFEFSELCLKELAHRARWIVAQLPPSDAELDFLATGKLPGQLEDK